MHLDPHRFFPADSRQRAMAAELFAEIEKLPIISPHGHTDPAWFAHDQPFEDAVSLLLWPDHYLLRLLYSVGITLKSIGIAPRDGSGGIVESDRRKIWKRFADHYHIFRGTPAAPGWITPSWRYSVSIALSGAGRRTIIMTQSTKNWHRPPSAPAPCSHDSISRRLPPRRLRSICCRITRQSRHRAGTGASSPPSAPTRSPTPIMNCSRRP